MTDSDVARELPQLRWMRISRLRVVVLAKKFAGVIAAGVLPSAASADVVQARGGGTWIWLGTGTKKYSNHTQWVSYITVMTGSGGACPGKLEGWTGGWCTAQPVCG
jgi:N-methylhydantoinase B/oxoprolinase/acetone carboxylase alpha subunit